MKITNPEVMLMDSPQLTLTFGKTNEDDDLLTQIKNKISPANEDTESAEELLRRLKVYVNISLTVEQCRLILQSLFPESPINLNAISKHEFSQLFDHLDNRAGFRLLFQRYSVPVLNIMGPEELKTFFRQEQEKSRSTRFCRHLIEDVNESLYGEASATLTAHGFYRLLSNDSFGLFNPIHEQVCQNMTYPLTHYFISTSPHLLYPTNKVEIANLKTLYPGIAKMYPSYKNSESAVLLAKYRHLLFTGTRCLQVELLWRSKHKCPLSIPIFKPKEDTYIYLSLDDFLTEVYWSAFKKSPYPVVLQFLPGILGDPLTQEKMDQLYSLVSSKFQSALYKPLAKQTKFPSVKSLHNKFLVYYFSCKNNANQEKNKKPSLLRGSLISNESKVETKKADKEPISSLVTLYEDHNKVTFWESFSANKRQMADQIEQNVALGEEVRNELPTVTERNLMSVYSFLEEEEMSNLNQTHQLTIKLLQVGVQCVPVDNPISQAFFRLNGNCGYVAKPIYLRKGGLYKRLSEDKSLKDELASCVFKYTLRIIGTSPLSSASFFDEKTQKLKMNSTITMRIIGHSEDAEKSLFQTRPCRSAGLTPYWNEQTRFRIRVPDLAFFYFELHNEGRLIGYSAIPVKAILKGNRHVPLYDGVTNEPIPQGKLFLHVDYKMITHGWKPSDPKPVTNEPKPAEIVSIPL